MFEAGNETMAVAHGKSLNTHLGSQGFLPTRRISWPRKAGARVLCVTFLADEASKSEMVRGTSPWGAPRDSRSLTNPRENRQ